MINKEITCDSIAATFKQNRELSWLKFNERVLEEAEDVSVPLWERLKFLAIFTSNLDEFFMIRVGSLFDMSVVNPSQIDNKSELTPREQLNKIYKQVDQQYGKRDQVFYQIEKQLRSYGIFSLNYNELNIEEKKFIGNYYRDMISPILSPQIVDSHHPFPHLHNKVIHISALLKDKGEYILGIIPVPSNLPELVFLPGDDLRYINIEKIIYEHINSVFEMYELEEKNYFCVTRNADISPDDEAYDMNLDFRFKMKKLLSKRKRLAIVRLETSHHLSHYFRQYLCEKFNISKNQIYKTKAPMNMGYAFSLSERFTDMQVRQLSYPTFNSIFPNRFLSNESIIKQVSKRDELLSYPYESIQPFLQVMKEASQDKNVISIKITIYRLAIKAKLVDYLCSAAENGKDVTVLIELRARFDEQNNIDWSERLEESGCKIIYGFENYKVHSKVCLITRKEKGKIKYITQIGTGNYNEKTSRSYTDLSLITHDQEIGKDASEFFKNMAIGNLDGIYKYLLVAPFGLKSNLLKLIDEQITLGQAGRIVLKVNSVTDIDIINKLIEASCAGVKIDMFVRGICCILPNIPGRTENLSVISIVGRFLEHSRIYCFGSKDEQKIFISSADMMTRNLDRRVEVACPVVAPHLKEKVNNIIETMKYDNVKSRVMDSSGNLHKKTKNKININCQEFFMQEAINENINRTPEKINTFVKLLSGFKLRTLLKNIK